jgi:hypothetical protein
MSDLPVDPIDSTTQTKKPRVRKSASKKQLPLAPAPDGLTLAERASRIRSTRLTAVVTKPWNSFMKEFKVETGPGQIHATAMSHKWRELKATPEYAEYVKRYNEQKALYQAQLDSLSPEERKVLRDELKEKRLERRGSVRHVNTAYMIFNREHHKKVRESVPGGNFGDTSRRVSALWRALTDGERAEYGRIAAASAPAVTVAE